VEIICPNADDITTWANWIAESGYLRKYLPVTDGRWAATIESEFQLTLLSQDRNDLIRFAARLFYRIIKNHRFLDGNKRSAVINVYLLVSLNGFGLDLSPRALYHLAKNVADSQDDQEDVICRITNSFSKDLKPLYIVRK